MGKPFMSAPYMAGSPKVRVRQYLRSTSRSISIV